MKKVLAASLLSFLFVLFHSCVKKPFACFKTDVAEDSIRVNQFVTFSSLCSSNVSDRFWEFYDNEDSVWFTRDVQKVFYDTGNIKVFLLVSNGNKTSSMTKTIHVNP